MSRTLIAAALSVAAFVLPASADLFTAHLDSLEQAVMERQAALPDKLSKAEKKAAKSYKSVVKKLSKTSISLGGDLKAAQSTVKLEKIGDEALNGLLDGAISGLSSEIQNRVDTLQARLDVGIAAAKSKVTPAKAQKAITKAGELIQIADGEEKRKKRVVKLRAANKSADKAEKLLEKLGFESTDPGGGGGGGGGGGQCGGLPFAPGDAAGGMFGAGAQWTGEEYTVDDSGPQLVISIYDCDGFGGRRYTITLPATIAPGQYDALATGSRLEVGPLDGAGTVLNQGQINITEAGSRLTLNYNFTGQIAYSGGLSIPLAP